MGTIYYPNGNTSSTSGTPASNNNSTTYLNLLTNMLQTGLSISNGDGSYCCPECLEGTERVYFLASLPKAMIILDTLGYQYGDKLNCCVNISSVTSSTAYTNFSERYTYDCCTNNFSSCVNELTSKLGAACCNELQQIGIVEYGTLELTESSPFCAVLANLLKVTPALTDEELCNIYKEILTEGIIIKCDGCNVTIEKGPPFPICYCYKITVPEFVGTKSVTVTCNGVTTPHTNLAIGDHYYCSESEPVVSNPAITYLQLADCSTVLCTNPPAPCTCYEFVIRAPNLAPIPLQVTCQGETANYSLTQGVHRYCSDTYPVVSPEVIVNILDDCDSEPCVAPPPLNCACYRIENAGVTTCSFEYKDCLTNATTFENIQVDQTIYLCASTESTFESECLSGLLVTQQSPDCSACLLPAPIPCVCYQVTVAYPTGGYLAICDFDSTNCVGAPVVTQIAGSGYICSQTVPVPGQCKGVIVTINQILTGDCTDPAIGCPPIIP